MKKFKKRAKKRVKIEEPIAREGGAVEVQFDETMVEYVVIPPDGGWGWMVVTAAFLSNMITDGMINSFGVFLEDVSLDLSTKASQIALANSILAGLYFMLGPFVCAMTNRMGFRIVAVVGGVISSTGLISSSYMPNGVGFIITYGGLIGLGSSMTYIPNVLAVGFYFERWRSVATSIAVCGTAVGTMLLPPIFNILLKDYTWRFKFKLLAAGTGFVSLMGFFFKPIPPSKVIVQENKGKDDDGKSLGSVSVNEENPKSIFYKMHNKGYPTNADLVAKTSYVVENYNTRGSEAGPTGSKASFKSYRNKQSNFSFVSERMGMIPEEHAHKKPRCESSCFCYRCQKHVQRPMYRDDILFPGSVANLPQYDRVKAEFQRSLASLDYHMSVTRVATPKDLEEQTRCCICCPEAVKRTLATMMDVSLLKSPAFLCLVLSGFFTYLGIYVPYIYTIDFAQSCGMDANAATYVMCALGVMNAIGRIATGLMTLIPNVNALLISDIGLFIGGVATVVVVFFCNKYVHYTYAGVFGLSMACLSSLRPIIAVDMLGLEKLSNSFGLIVLFEGIASLFGLPVSALLKEVTNSYTVPYCFSGGCIIVSVFFLIPIKPLMKWETKKKLQKEKAERERRLEETRQKLAKINKPDPRRKYI